MIVPNPNRNYPPRWATFDSLSGLAQTVFTSSADVYRFGARYRLARAFRGLDLEDYSGPTANGYSALTRLAFTYSAFEGLMTAVSNTPPKYAGVLDPSNWADCLQAVRTIDPTYQVFGFLHNRLRKPYRAAIGAFLVGQPCSGILLAGSIRHIFLHGDLTPNAAQCPPSTMSAVCNRLTTAMFRVMDREFRERVEELILVAEQL